MRKPDSTLVGCAPGAYRQGRRYDLGAGTCDVTLLRPTFGGFEVVASDGLNDVGGLDIDAAIVAFPRATYGTLWTDASTRRQVWDEVCTAKEMLSRSSSTVVVVPGRDRGGSAGPRAVRTARPARASADGRDDPGAGA